LSAAPWAIQLLIVERSLRQHRGGRRAQGGEAVTDAVHLRGEVARGRSTRRHAKHRGAFHARDADQMALLVSPGDFGDANLRRLDTDLARIAIVEL
jgi:hypothetical protein